MAAPLPSWDLVRVYGTWRGMDGALRPGSYKVTIPARITNSTDDAIIPAGTYASGQLQTAVDGSPSFDLMAPATDDPDNEQTGWKVTVDVSFTDAAAERYVIDVPVANRPSASGGNGLGVNLRTVAIAAQIPQQVALYRVGVPGGLARLDSAGKVIDADGNPVTGGGADWDSLTGKPVVIAAGSSQTAARAAIGAGTSSLQLGVGPTTAKAGDWTPTWVEVSGKPANFPPSVHGHAIADVTGLQAALDAKGTSNLTLGTTASTAKAGNYAPTWGEVTGKPATFAPSTHSHATADVTGLDAALAGKANFEDVPTTLSSLGGTITTAQMAPRSVICAIWDGTAWTNSPAGSRKDIMVQWVDPIGTSTTPPFVAGRVDVYIKAQ